MGVAERRPWNSQFGSLPGVIATRVGYAGGEKSRPSYYDMGDHTEAIEVTYDPERISYAELLAVFWSAHDPVHEPWSVQYRSAIWPADAEQQAQAEQSMAAERHLLKRVGVERDRG